LVQVKDYSGALAAYQKALQLDRDNAVLYSNRSARRPVLLPRAA
jgi:cytochrome c-type biogenesis protein CcmH/NrfG